MIYLIFSGEDCEKCVPVEEFVESLGEEGKGIVVRKMRTDGDYRRELIRYGAFDAVQRTLPVLVDVASGEIHVGQLKVLSVLRATYGEGERG